MKSKTIILFGAIFFSGVLVWGSLVSAATIFTDNFNSYTLWGTLNGQGSWSAHPFFQVIDNPANEGGKAVYSSVFGYSVSAVKSGALLQDGKITVYVRRVDANQPGVFWFRLKEGNIPKVEVRGNYAANVRFQYPDGSNGSYVNFGPPFAYSTWYGVQIEWRSLDHAFRYNIDGGPWTDWAVGFAPWVNGLDTVELENTDTIFWDTIQENPVSTKTPVLIVPGLMGTEIKNGSELLWADISRMVGDSSDTFMDSLVFNNNLTAGNSSVASADVIRRETILNVELSNYIDKLVTEFKNQGYVEDQTLFTFPYDWRYGVSGKNASGKTNSDLLAEKIQQILQQTGAQKVDVVAHSMGGLIVKQYVSNHVADNHIGKAVFVGVPELGAVKTIKALLLGDNFDISFAGFGLSADEIKKISANMPAAYDLLPSQQYYDTKGSFVKVVQKGDFAATQKDLNYQDFENYMGIDHGFNQQALVNAEALHSTNFDNFDMRPAGVDTYVINGCKIATLDNIVETRQNTALGNFTSSYNTIKFNDGDNTVPIESSASLPVNSDHVFYSLKTKHSDLLSATGSRQEIVNLISGSSLGVGDGITKDSSKCGLNGKVIEKHSPVNVLATDEIGNQSGVGSDGNIVNTIPGADYEAFGDQGYLYLPTDDGQTYTVSMEGTGTGTYTIKTDDIQNNDVVKTQVFSNLPVTPDLTGTVNLGSFQDTLTVNQQTILPSSVISGAVTQDVLPPVSAVTLTGTAGQAGFYRSDVGVAIQAQDAGSGVLRIWYKVDGGAYLSAAPLGGAALTLSTEGRHTVSYFATDNAGNNEPEKTITFTIDKTAPEALIEFDPAVRDLKFSAPDDPAAGVTYSGDVVTLIDLAGNKTEITLNKNHFLLMSAQIVSIKYNGAAANINSNAMVYGWLLDKSKKLVALSQYVKSKNSYNILAVYNGKTTSFLGKDASGMISKSFSGLKIIRISTNKGDFSWSY